MDHHRARADRAVPPLRPERERALETTGEIGDVAAGRLAGRTRFVNTVSRGAWRLAGNRSRPPAWLVDLFAIHLSAFSTRELVSDFGRSAEEVAAMSARVLISAVRSATSECGRVTQVRSAP